jgi:uncharacterized protein (DUF58 family)
MGQLALGLVLVLVGSWLATPPIVLLGLVIAFAEGVRQVWVRYGMAGVEYRRSIPEPRVVVGDEMRLDIIVWNRKALPLAWLRVEDQASARVVVRERDLTEGAGGAVLRNAWTLAPFERVTRHFHVVAERRGVYSLGPARLATGDLFAREAALGDEGRIDRWLVRPRQVAVAIHERDERWGGERRARRGPIEDPTRYAGVRPYQPGDSIRRVHWRATARTGSPVSRRFEPGREREIVVVLDLLTVSGPLVALEYDDDAVETLCVAAASIVRRLRADGAAVGLAAPGYAGGIRPFAFVPPGSAGDQVGRCLDLLARLGSTSSVPVGRLVTTLVRQVRPGTAFVVLTARDPSVLAPVLRRVAASGHPVQVVAMGAGATSGASVARGGGLDVRVGRLDGPWRTATTLVIA